MSENCIISAQTGYAKAPVFCGLLGDYHRIGALTARGPFVGCPAKRTKRNNEDTFGVSENSGIVIRRMAARDVPAVVRLHTEVFKGYDNTMMGIGYLRGLYRVLSCHASCISIVGLRDDEIVAWIGGVWDWLSFQKALTRRNLLGAPGILLSILKNRPRVITKVFSFVRPVVSESIQRFKGQSVPGERTPPSLEAALLVIGVEPHHQNQGVGQSMIEGFNRLLLSKGFMASTVSTRIDNKAGNRAFQKAGYRLYRANSGVNFYIRHLTEPGSE